MAYLHHFSALWGRLRRPAISKYDAKLTCTMRQQERHRDWFAKQSKSSQRIENPVTAPHALPELTASPLKLHQYLTISA